MHGIPRFPHVSQHSTLTDCSPVPTLELRTEWPVGHFRVQPFPGVTPISRMRPTARCYVRLSMSSALFSFLIAKHVSHLCFSFSRLFLFLSSLSIVSFSFSRVFFSPLSPSRPCSHCRNVSMTPCDPNVSSFAKHNYRKLHHLLLHLAPPYPTSPHLTLQTGKHKL